MKRTLSSVSARWQPSLPESQVERATRAHRPIINRKFHGPRRSPPSRSAIKERAQLSAFGSSRCPDRLLAHQQPRVRIVCGGPPTVPLQPRTPSGLKEGSHALQHLTFSLPNLPLRKRGWGSSAHVRGRRHELCSVSRRRKGSRRLSLE